MAGWGKYRVGPSSMYSAAHWPSSCSTHCWSFFPDHMLLTVIHGRPINGRIYLYHSSIHSWPASGQFSGEWCSAKYNILSEWLKCACVRQAKRQAIDIQRFLIPYHTTSTLNMDKSHTDKFWIKLLSRVKHGKHLIYKVYSAWMHRLLSVLCTQLKISTKYRNLKNMSDRLYTGTLCEKEWETGAVECFTQVAQQLFKHILFIYWSKMVILVKLNLISVTKW